MLNVEWVEPETLEDVKHALASGDDLTRVVSGGTALSLIIKQGIYQPERLISLKKVRCVLNYIRPDNDGNLRIGAMTTLREMETSPFIEQNYPVISKALHHVANPRIRYVASIGGNLSHGDAHLDLPPFLLALDAKVKVESVRGDRWIPLADFFQGYYVTAVRPDELVTEVLLPKTDPGLKGAYIKYTTLSNDDWPTLGVAAFIQQEQGILCDVRMAVSAVTDVPAKLEAVEQLLLGKPGSEAWIEQAAEMAFHAVEPSEDLRGSSWYKKEMLKVHVRRVLQQLLPEGQKG
ncbi:xanthine dehydrogenase family protein subunit M [Paenibacillus naphthalenovorans]|uniref:FAD binding domain-containing protein n=1 Tax=Paenibacillus naphthalenovorans TaxID=162209 RepID=UPI0010B5DB9E|nr:xanthine dehydrogenase family protein subunit M [Paenibacillus naphthalenovorans]GCL70163.1 xanthine dehydrogenase family protein subunit M [Paenibacillus naphthalenovorans]